ncbi:MFS transporter [Robinsoniella peoriensis]
MFKRKRQEINADMTKLGANQKIGILFCAMVSAVATGYVPNYINLYYTDTVGISMGAVAMILMLTKITDGVTDIIMGMIVDRTHTRLGKARPWVLAGGIGIAVSIMLLFNCPGGLSTTGKVVFCAACYFLANPFFGTMVSVACGTMNNLLTADSKQRGVLGVFSAYGSLVSVLIIGLVVPKILSAMNESQAAYTVSTLVFAVLAIIASVIGVLCTRETVTEHSKDTLTEKQPILESLKALVKNKYFIYLAIGTILYNLTAAPVANYYAKYIFYDVGVATIINLPGMLLIFLLPFAVPLINKFGKRNCIVYGMVIAAVGHIVILFAEANLVVFMIGKTVSSIAAIPFTVALIPLTGEVCDYALFKTGKPMDGTISSAATMGGKIGIGLAAGISGLMMSVSGYISSEADSIVTQPGSAILMIRILLSVYPAVLFLLSAFCFHKINLDKIGIADIQRELKEKGMR